MKAGLFVYCRSCRRIARERIITPGGNHHIEKPIRYGRGCHSLNIRPANALERATRTGSEAFRLTIVQRFVFLREDGLS